MRDVQGRTLVGKHQNDDEDPDAFERAPTRTGEHALWTALLEDAARCAKGTAASLRYYEQVQARAWLAETTRTALGSLRWVCDHVGVDPVRFSALALSAPWKPLPQRREYLSPSDAAGIVADIRAGHPYTWIARRHGIPHSTVRSVAARAGIRRYMKRDREQQATG